MVGTVTGDTIFSSGDVSVTRTLIRVDGVSYPVNGIGSVLIKKPNKTRMVIMGIITAAMGLSAMSSTNEGVGFAALILGAVIGILVTFNRISLFSERPAVISKH